MHLNMHLNRESVHVLVLHLRPVDRVIDRNAPRVHVRRIRSRLAHVGLAESSRHSRSSPLSISPELRNGVLGAVVKPYQRCLVCCVATWLEEVQSSLLLDTSMLATCEASGLAPHFTRLHFCNSRVSGFRSRISKLTARNVKHMKEICIHALVLQHLLD